MAPAMEERSGKKHCRNNTDREEEKKDILEANPDPVALSLPQIPHTQVWELNPGFPWRGMYTWNDHPQHF
jgi:hypothetical protein